MLSVFMLNVPNNPIMLSIIMLFVVLLNVIVLSVVAPSLQMPRLKFKCFKYLLSLFLDSRKTGDSLQNDILDKRVFLAQGGSIMVQHRPCHSEVKGSIPATTSGPNVIKLLLALIYLCY